MLIYFATSCLSSLPLVRACEELAALGESARAAGLISDWGLQLCPGHRGHGGATTDATVREVWRIARGERLRLHHGFAFHAAAQHVWTPDGRLLPLERLPHERTIHPPASGTGPRWMAAAESAVEAGAIHGIELMYPGYEAGDLASVPDNLPLAIDVSHLHLWSNRRQVLRRLDARPVVEVHVSANDGTADQHRPLAQDTFGLRWATERARSGTPLVLEYIMRGLPRAERMRQLEILAGA